VENSKQRDPTRKAGTMIVKARPLLCELHAHTTWSDGTLSLPELVDLYGSNGFDVLVVSDHVLRCDDPWPLGNPGGSCVSELSFAAYLEAIQVEAERARATYDLLVIPGLELTYNDPQPDLAGHAVAVGLRTFVSMDGGLGDAMSEARSSGAAIIAAHPHSPDHELSDRATRHIFREWRLLGGLIDRFELFNQREVFSWVANAGLPSVASGDFHRPEHLSSWKTLIPCDKREAEVVSYLRSSRPVYITRLERELGEQQAAA
jgi:3',5'-nucleoside bisphosphate phosphatase